MDYMKIPMDIENRSFGIIGKEIKKTFNSKIPHPGVRKNICKSEEI